MIATMIFAAALSASPAASTADGIAQAQSSGTVYGELAQSQAEATILRILASDQFDSKDPATLINLGAAYAKIGQKDRALAMYRAAIASPASAVSTMPGTSCVDLPFAPLTLW